MKFENVYKEAEENLRLALLSLWAPGKHPMRGALEKLFKEEPLIAEPVFQSTFGWEQVQDDSWKQYFNPDVRQELNIGEAYIPYKHQAESWKELHDGKSIVVTSGTGSGKTECFMYPVINDLVEQGNQNVIQAIFLYPLNALMEDQKTRLASFCDATALKFAVYNGDTPEYREDGRDEGGYRSQVKTRDAIRDNNEMGTRPQILLSNPSMLEYILVRQKDQRMLQASAGKLRWIVIDEAHSYSGSSAVELAYQIKRILEAFNVRPQDVRFACTSATIGGESGEQSLAKFISEIIGQDVSNIKVIGGNRLVPAIRQEALTAELSARHLQISSDALIHLRNLINTIPGMTLQQIWSSVFPDSDYTIQRALKLVDLLCELKVGDAPVLSLRAHFFMRSISGLYGCANEWCPGSSGTPYGHLTTYKAAVCPKCGKPLLEIVQCKRCGSFILMGKSNPQTKEISPFEDGYNHDDYFAINNDNDNLNDTEEEATGSPDSVFYLTPFVKEKFSNPNSNCQVSTLDIVHGENMSTLETRPYNSGHWVEVQKDAHHSYCPTCGNLAYGQKLRFKYFRIPINFINQTISPVLLHESAPEGQSWGKYIAFTDSRQGTAISAKTFNIDVERRVSRSRLVKEFATRASEAQPAGIDIETLRAAHVPEAQINAIIKLQENQHGVPQTITLDQVADIIFDEKLFDHIAGEDKNADKTAYKYSLVRQFIGSKSLYDNGPESMGLLSLVYPALNDIQAPESLVELGNECGVSIKDQDWRDFLKIAIDYYLRQNNIIQPLYQDERKFIRDTNLSKPISASGDRRTGISAWPDVKTGDGGNVSNLQNRLIVLLCAALKIDSKDKLQDNATKIDRIMSDAWATLVDKHILTKVDANDHEGYNNPKYYPNGQYVGCYYIDLSPRDTNRVCLVKRAEKVWRCPVTGNLLDTIFCGISPLIYGELAPGLFDRYRCTEPQLEMPLRPDEDSAVKAWMQSDERVNDLHDYGVWTDRHKYTYYSLPTYIAAEHSAQQSKALLREYTKAFSARNPAINVLHCSTTMEMGVDIGDIDVVLMDTVPPTAANYLQRVGRAGRKGQTKSVAFSLCNNTPVGQNAFADPMWALKTSNHMVPVRSSQTIVQRHINSFFFRQFICVQGEGIQASISVGDFMEGTCAAFIQFLDEMSTNRAMESNFRKVFGPDMPYSIELTKEAIINIQIGYNEVIDELKVALQAYQDDERRKVAISNQIKKIKQLPLLNYLSEHQFIPNASMPTGIVTFDFTDREQSQRLFKLYRDQENLIQSIDNETDEAELITLRQKLADVQRKIQRLRNDTQATREIRMALNEYAPGQTVVVNEKNYVSAGIMLFGAYNEQTQTKAIYFCENCGKTEYKDILAPRTCPNCGMPFRSILNDRTDSSYTLAYEPIGFRTDQNIDSSREEKTEKHFFDIRPVLLNSDWSTHSDVNMCQVANSGEKGEILYYNVGTGAGFAFCKRCGRAAVEESSFGQELPYQVKRGHKRLWGDDCEATEADIARHVVFTGRHQTCYSVLRFEKVNGHGAFEKDVQLVYSLGVILKRALTKYLGIDENEIDFGVKTELDDTALFIFDTARGGCGYSLHFSKPNECEEIFKIAREMLASYTCHCEKDGGACARCLVDRNNYRYSNLLYKGKTMEWLEYQKTRTIHVPDDIAAYSSEAVPVLQSVKGIFKESIDESDVRCLTLCVSDNTSETSVNDWVSIRSEMGKLLKKAVEKGKIVNLRVEYHDDIHESNADKYPFVNLDSKFVDFDVQFVKDMGAVKTMLIVTDSTGKNTRYFTKSADALSFSNSWGEGNPVLFADSKAADFETRRPPVLDLSPSEIIREGITIASSIRVDKYFSEGIAPGILKASDLDKIKNLIGRKHVKIHFSDMYVNSALASLMLVYLIKEMRALFGFTIDEVTLQLDSSKRNCRNDRFSDYSRIYYNFPSAEDADDYTYNLFEDVLGVIPEKSAFDAEHHRWLRFVTAEGDVVEIRPDHSISGGWISSSTYMNLNILNGAVKADRGDGDILYYVIIIKHE